MARIRTIKPDFWQHPKTGLVSRNARLLFLGLLNEADDEGRMRYSAKRLAGVLFSFDDDVTPAVLTKWIVELEQVRLVARYEVESASYLEVCGFTEHQRVNRPQVSTLPERSHGAITEPSLNGHGTISEGARGELEGEWEREEEGELIAPAVRKIDVLWEAMLEVCDIHGAISPSARGAYNKARSDLAACDATPDTIRQRATVFRMRWPSVSLTPTALSRRWSECEPNVGHLPVQKVSPVEAFLVRDALEHPVNRGEARGLYASMLAIWPGAKPQHGLDTAQAWFELLEETPADDARAAVVELRVSVDWFPSMAQFHQCVADSRAIRAERGAIRPAIGAPQVVDKSGRAHLEAIVGWLKTNHAPVCARELDKAGVKNWRGRLAHAREDDERMSTRRGGDAAWAQVRSELGLPPLVLPDGREFG